jgi:3-methylcrotonyl-CoA carboxylase alpha subunit
MFSKLLIANRGEIACRVARTAKRLGLRTVAVYSDADAHAAHVAACDEAVHIGGPRPQESYLRGDVILAAAKRMGADAIHPGYGFLSENAEFAAACGRAGITFVGPTPEAIAAMGSKSAAKALMEKAGVPLTPGYHGERQEPDYLLKQAESIGFPVLIKAVAGGGGKGMRRVDRAADFSAALASCQREAAASFKDDRVLVEKYLTHARHIEVQVFGDNHGNAVYLFERDCSVQRRHQKVIEEAPAPGMTAERRRQMGEAAVAAARAVDYRGAGTVEFIAAGDAFYFMEMNTRLQVEHPVTEMITGLDLVEWQLRVAAGEPLPRSQDQLAIGGHAIEARIYAEDPSREFLPSIGKLVHLVAPSESASVRVDTGVRQGDEITPYYDPMIAKLVVHGESRDEAIARMRSALAQYQIVGVRTNVEFLGRLMTAPSFVNAALDTALIDRECELLFAPRSEAAREMWERAAQAAWGAEHAKAGVPGASPWNDHGGWALGARGDRRLKLREGEVEREVAGRYSAGAAAGTYVTGSEVHLFSNGEHRVFEWIDPYLPEAEHADAHGGLRAMMPGRVLAVHVKPGDDVAKGAPLVVLEAMKMEQTITAPSAGKIDRVLCAVGDQVREGAELLTFAGAN